MNSKALSQSYLKVKILNEEEEECLLETCNGDNSKREVVDEDGKAAEEGAKLNEKEEEEKEKEIEEQLYEEIEEDKEREKDKEGRVEEASKDKKNENIVNSPKPEKTEEEREGEIKKKATMKESNKELITEESREADAEKYASLAMPEVSDEENDLKDEPQHEIITVHENFEIPTPELGCKQCFQILDENMQRKTNGDGCEHDIRVLKDLAFDDDETAKMFHEMYSAEKDTDTSWKCGLDEPSETAFRASLRSLSTCQDSLPSSRGTNKHSLTLDLECRICHDTEGQDLISPCHCAGTSKWVHESCIIRWIRHTKTKQCEICTCPIAVKRRKKPIEQWTRPSASCGPCNRLDIWYCFVVALCVVIIIGFVVLQNRYDVTEQIETTVIFASIYVLCGMIIMMKLRYFWTWFVQRSSFWGNWKNLNEEWRIIEANEPNMNSPQSPV